MVPGSMDRQRSTSAAPVTWPSLAARTSTRTRRCGVQRRPRARSRSGTVSQGASATNDPTDDIARSIGGGPRHGPQMQPVAIGRRRAVPCPSTRGRPLFDVIAAVSAATTSPAGVGVLLTGLVLGIRHGIDWDHIAAITDITSTTAAATVAEAAHEEQHVTVTGRHHPHGGAVEKRAHDAGPGAATVAPAVTIGRRRIIAAEQ